MWRTTYGGVVGDDHDRHRIKSKAVALLLALPGALGWTHCVLVLYHLFPIRLVPVERETETHWIETLLIYGLQSYPILWLILTVAGIWGTVSAKARHRRAPATISSDGADFVALVNISYAICGFLPWILLTLWALY